MNKTAIEWTDYTWNPITGCWGPGGTAEAPNRCPYCYAERVAKRFVYQDHDGPDPFAPTFHPDRLSQPAKVKKPTKIFVCSMADLFGDWVPSEWILDVLAVVRDCPQHTFQFLTKNPKRLSLWNGTWPSNCWVGTTVTNHADANERLPWLAQVEASVRFVSHEPLLGPIQLQGLNHSYLEGPRLGKPGWKLRHTYGIDWAIIGAMTGPGAVKVELSWVFNLVDQYRAAGVPVFLKNNCPWSGAKKIQEWPA